MLLEEQALVRYLEFPGKAGTHKQVVAVSVDNPPAVNGLHHPTGVYDNRSKNHLLSINVTAAEQRCQRSLARPKGPVVVRSHDP